MKRRGFFKALVTLMVAGPVTVLATGAKVTGPRFKAAQEVLRASFNWKEYPASMVVTWEELRKDGITIVDKGIKVI